MNKIEVVQLFFKKYIDKIKLAFLFNICLLLLEERKIIDIQFPEKNNQYDIIIKLFSKKYFKYNKSIIKVHSGKSVIRISCTLSKNKKILNKFKTNNFTRINDKLYGKYLEKDFYKCTLDKNNTHFISINIKYISFNKNIRGNFLIQKCSLKDFYKNIKTIIQLMEKYESIALKISKNLKCDISITKI